MKVFFSFDIDAIRAADCPGVSCPSPIGLTAEAALQLCRLAGQSSCVSLFDISEFNPTMEKDRTSRLVCTMLYYFLVGLAERSKHQPTP
ncbi:unnamed protein product [Protopolystoma xenopodis]|uniref:Arginase n=1 Tax=Protopolystoma xenopodis TaxID=117903 RepID=A0A3S5BP54_9PLAT|nr:unnamed protein product [Protopolystoma xenopodis]